MSAGSLVSSYRLLCNLIVFHLHDRTRTNFEVFGGVDYKEYQVQPYTKQSIKYSHTKQSIKCIAILIH